MKKFVLLGIILSTSVLTTSAQIFTPGNLAVMRLSGQGSSSGATETGATNIIDQYTTGGSLVSSFAVPTSGANSIINPALSDAGLLTLTPDNSKLVFTGYNVTGGLPATGAITSQSGTTYPRVVATLDAYGDLALPVKTSTVFSANTIIGAASDGTNYWASGSVPSGEFYPGINPQVVYLGTVSSSAAVQVATNLFSTSVRGVNVYNVAGTYNLFVAGSVTNTAFSSTSNKLGNFVLSNISGVLPTSGTTSSNLFPQGSTGSFPFDIAINPAGTTAYVADNDNGIVKYTFNSSSWVSNYTVPLNGTFPITNFDQSATSVAADWTKSPPVVYATTGETLTNRLISFSDTGATATISNLAFGNVSATVTNTFRGVRFVPLPVPFITTQPVSFTGNPGVTATFTAAVLGTGNSYQWYSNSVANPTFVAISGAASTNLTLSGITTAQNGSMFYLVASNIYGTAQTTPVTLTVLNPAITTQPVGATNIPGGPTAMMCVSAVGTGTLSYQWYSNGISLGTSAQSSCYTPPSSAVSNSATYTVVVTNTGPGVTSITSTPTVVSYTPYLVYDTFTYPNGDIFGDAGSPWTEESGSNPIYVTNGTVQISGTIGSLGTAFGQDLFSQTIADGSTVLWASFTVNLQSLPTTPAGTYLAYFQSTNFNFYGRIIAITSNNPAYTPDIPAVAYPGTYRLGIANAAATPSAVVELDMSPGINYQVVEYYDTINHFCQLSVNPSPTNYAQVYSPGVDLPSSLVSALSTDGFTPTNLPMAAYGLRQAANVGVIDLDNLEVSFDWSTNGSGFAAVTDGNAPAKPVIGFVSPSFTNYSGNSNTMEVAASGIGVTYQWYQGATPLSDGNSILGSSTCALTINPGVGSNSGTYTCVVGNSAGSTTSSNIVVFINSTPTAPMFTLEPVSVTSSLGNSVTFTATAVGTGPITYAWNLNGSPSGATGSSYTLSGLTTNMSGDFISVTATGGTALQATSTNAILTVNGPIVTNIAFLRSLQVTNAAPTITVPASNSTAVYQVTGYVIESTNIESPTLTEYWIEDATGGIELFIDQATSFRPQFGDLVTATGIVDVFDDALELNSGFSLQQPDTIVSTNNENAPLPFGAELIPFGFATANPGLSSLSYQGKLGVFTNCYFTTPGGAFSGNATYTVTNSSGQSYELYIAQSAGPDLAGATIPAFAYSITGVYDQFTTAYELNLSAGTNIVTAPPPAVTDLAASSSGANITLNWTAVAGRYTYSVWATTNLSMPFTPLAPGLWFSTSQGTYTAAVPTNTPAIFYKIVSP